MTFDAVDSSVARARGLRMPLIDEVFPEVSTFSYALEFPDHLPACGSMAGARHSTALHRHAVDHAPTRVPEPLSSPIRGLRVGAESIIRVRTPIPTDYVSGSLSTDFDDKIF